MVRTVALFFGLLVCGRVDGASALVNKDESDFKLELVVNLLDRILLEASALSIETYSLVGTNESFLRGVVDRLASRCNRLMLPFFNNAVARHAPTRQLVIVGGDSVKDIMASLVNAFRYQPIRFFGTNSRDIYVILVLSDLRFIEPKKFLLLRVFFCTFNFLVVSPPSTQYQQPVLVATDYADRAMVMAHDTPMGSLFADRFQSQDVPAPVKVWGAVKSARLWQDAQEEVIGPDWSVFRTILEHLGLRWKLTVHQYSPSLKVNEWLNEQLYMGAMDIYIDRGFLPSARSVVHFLPEMNGYCMVVPKAKKYEVLRHLLSPVQPTCWIVLGVALCVGSLLAQRYFRHSLPSALLFGVDLNAPGVSRVERVLLFCSLVLFFIFSEAYQAKLLSLMTSQRYPPDPRTVADFLRTDIMLELGESTARVVTIRSEFAGRITNHTDYGFTFDGNLEHGVLMPCPSAWVHLLQWTREQYVRHGHNVRPAVHIVGEKLLSLVASYSFSGAFTLYPRFRDCLDRLFESGLVTYWQTWEGSQQLYEGRFEFLDSTTIAFGDLSTVWIVLAIGYAMAVLMFLVELSFSVVHRYMRLRREQSSN